MSKEGTIVQVIGPVVDADFSDATEIPALFNALELEYDLYGVPTKLVLEVQKHLGGKWVRAVAMSTTEGLRRGMKLKDTGEAISVPVGEGVLGSCVSASRSNPVVLYPLARVSTACGSKCWNAWVNSIGCVFRIRCQRCWSDSGKRRYRPI